MWVNGDVSLGVKLCVFGVIFYLFVVVLCSALVILHFFVGVLGGIVSVWLFCITSYTKNLQIRPVSHFWSFCVSFSHFFSLWNHIAFFYLSFMTLKKKY